MYMWACAGLRSAGTFTVRCASWLILLRADASASGSPEMSAPSLSASYSRVRLTAICTRAAAMGATITAISTPIGPSGLSRELPPPKNRPNCASIEMAPAMVAVIVMVRVSRLRIWASSCATTAATSRGSR